MFFGLRFDFRNPPFAEVTTADRYAAALDMAQWADRLGAMVISVSEHHGSDDGYLPSPVTMLAAMSARTSTTRMMIAALIAPFHDPIRLAEDLAVLDNLSGGRVDLVLAAGYVPSEFDMFGVPAGERGARLVETIETLRSAFTGEPFDYRGRRVVVTPKPSSPTGPALLLGGSSEAAARRAARIGDGFLPTSPQCWDFYRQELATLGKSDPGECPVPDSVTVVALANDVERAWEQLGPYFLHETNAYGAWSVESGLESPYRTMADVDEVRSSGNYRIITPDEFVAEMRSSVLPFQMFHPMCGGIPPDLAWESLHLFENDILPRFSSNA